MRAGTPHDESVQIIPSGSQVRRMRIHADSSGVRRVVTVDLPDGRGTVELWVALDVAPVLAAQLVDGPVELPADMGDYREFTVGELTGLQEDGIDCARCGRDVEGSAVAVRRVGFSHESDALVVACHPRCGSSPWDVEQLRCLLEMPAPDEDFVDGSPGDLFDEPSSVSVPPRAGERAAWQMARGESAVNPDGGLYDPTDPAGAA